MWGIGRCGSHAAFGLAKGFSTSWSCSDDRDLAEVDDCASVRHGESASPWSEGSCEDDAVDTDYAISVGEGEEFVALPVAASNGIPDFAFLTLLAGMTRGPSVMMIEGR